MTPPLKFGPKARKKNWVGFSVKKPSMARKKFSPAHAGPKFFFSGGFSVKKALYGQKKNFGRLTPAKFFFGGSSVLDPGVGADPPAPP